MDVILVNLFFREVKVPVVPYSTKANVRNKHQIIILSA